MLPQRYKAIGDQIEFAKQKGMAIKDAIVYLHGKGYSVIDCIVILSEVYEYPHVQLKEMVSDCFCVSKEAINQFHDDLEKEFFLRKENDDSTQI